MGGKAIKMPIYAGDELLAGDVVNGPAVIEQKTATTVIPENNICTVDDFGNFIVDYFGEAE